MRRDVRTSTNSGSLVGNHAVGAASYVLSEEGGHRSRIGWMGRDALGASSSRRATSWSGARREAGFGRGLGETLRFFAYLPPYVLPRLVPFPFSIFALPAIGFLALSSAALPVSPVAFVAAPHWSTAYPPPARLATTANTIPKIFETDSSPRRQRRSRWRSERRRALFVLLMVFNFSLTRVAFLLRIVVTDLNKIVVGLGNHVGADRQSGSKERPEEAHDLQDLEEDFVGSGNSSDALSRSSAANVAHGVSGGSGGGGGVLRRFVKWSNAETVPDGASPAGRGITRKC